MSTKADNNEEMSHVECVDTIIESASSIYSMCCVAVGPNGYAISAFNEDVIEDYIATIKREAKRALDAARLFDENRNREGEL